MSVPSSQGVDEAMAKLLVQPSSENALAMVRATRRLKVLSEQEGKKEIAERADVHLQNSMDLHGMVLTLESDPEIVERNILARVISGIFPAMHTIEEFTTHEDRSPYDIIMNALGVVSELAQATQYLEGTRLLSLANSERALVRVEQRLVDLALETPGEPDKELDSVESFIDSVRGMELNPRDRPFIPFMLWIFISIISYKRLKDLM
jgi:hypothetical protein